MLSLVGPDQPLVLNLSDETQLRFLQTQMRAAGFDERQSPAFFASLNAAQAEHTALGGPPAPAKATVSSPWTDANLIMSVGREPNGTYTASALSTFVEGTSYTKLLLQLQDRATGQVFASEVAGPEFGKGEFVTVQANGAAPVDHDVRALYTYWYKQSGNVVSATVYRDVDLDPKSPPQVAAPVHTVTKAGSAMRVGLNRGGPDLDYSYQTGEDGRRQPIIGVAVQGTCEFKSPILQPLALNDNFDGVLYLFNRKGGIYLPIQAADMLQYMTARGTTLTWNFVPAIFGPSPWESDDTVDILLSLSVKTQEDPSQFITMTVGSESSIKDSEDTTKIDPLTFVWHCLAADTMVSMADGAKVKIDEVRGAERVRTANGGLWTILDTLRTEKHASLWQIKTDLGHSLLASDGHPIVTLDGVKLVKQLQVGMKVVTEDGDTAIVAITELPYSGAVYNIDLVQGAGDPVAVTHENTTFFANGILVGDNQMQGYFNNLHDDRPETILAKLPKEWHQDFLNHLAATQQKG